MPNRFNDRLNGESRGEYGPAPWYAHQGQNIEESYGGYSGQEYEPGVYGHKNPEYPNMEHEDGSRSFRRYEPGRFAGRGPKGYKRSDERIEEDVCERLTQHPDLDASEISVQVQDCEVTLSGTVEDRHSKKLAENIVDSVSGVKDVHNQIKISQKSEQNIENFQNHSGSIKK